MERFLSGMVMLCLFFCHIGFTFGQTAFDSSLCNSITQKNSKPCESQRTAIAMEKEFTDSTFQDDSVFLIKRTTYYLTTPNALPHQNTDLQFHSFNYGVELEKPITPRFSVRTELRRFFTLSISAWYKFRIAKQVHASIGTGHSTSLLAGVFKAYEFPFYNKTTNIHGFHFGGFFTFGEINNNLSVGIRNYSNYRVDYNSVLWSLGGIKKIYKFISLVGEANALGNSDQSFGSIGIRLQDQNGQSLDFGLIHTFTPKTPRYLDDFPFTEFALPSLFGTKTPTGLFLGMHIHF